MIRDIGGFFLNDTVNICSYERKVIAVKRILSLFVCTILLASILSGCKSKSSDGDSYDKIYDIKYTADDENNFTFINGKGDWSIQDGTLVYPEKADETVTSALFDPIGDTSQDMAVTTELQITSGGFHGIFFRRPTTSSDKQNNTFYAVGVDYESSSSSSLKILKYLDGQLDTYTLEGGFKAELNTKYILDGEISGTTLYVSLKDSSGNPIKSLNWDDNTSTTLLKSGYAGLINERNSAIFANTSFKLRKVGAPVTSIDFATNADVLYIPQSGTASKEFDAKVANYSGKVEWKVAVNDEVMPEKGSMGISYKIKDNKITITVSKDAEENMVMIMATAGNRQAFCSVAVRKPIAQMTTNTFPGDALIPLSDEGNWSVNSNTPEKKASSADSTALFKNIGETIGDSTGEVAISGPGKGETGFVLRRAMNIVGSRADDYYFAGISSTGDTAALKVSKVMDGKEVDSSSKNITISKGTDYTLAFNTTGYEISLSIKDGSGKEIDKTTYTDKQATKAYNHGYLGLKSGSDGTVFKNLKISYIPMQVDKILDEADWIMLMSMPDGALANYVDLAQVRPYMSHFAALGLVRATEISGYKSYAEAAWKWAKWYAAHMDETGFVTDYNMEDGKWVSTNDMDSTDSYAALYLMLLEQLYDVTGDKAQLNQLKSSIPLAVKAIEATTEPDGMSWAKPSYKVKYLMDISETYSGLKSAVNLAKITGDSALASKADGMAKKLAAGIETLWDANTNSYAKAKNQTAMEKNEWSFFYNDAVSEAWTAAFGVPDIERSKTMLSLFEKSHPYWDQPAQQADFRDSNNNAEKQKVYYWPVVGWAYSRIGDFNRAIKAADNISSAGILANRSWPYTSKVGGESVILMSGGY
jgi:hypothetical protein